MQITHSLNDPASFLLGFAAGAMLFMVLVELLPEAFDQGRRTEIATLTTASIIAMVLFQRLL